VGSNFGGGANFAAAGAAALDNDSFIAPIPLSVQLNQFKVFKQQVLATINDNGSLSNLPSAEAFKSGLYTIAIGGNDLNSGYMNFNLDPTQVKTTLLPKVAESIAGAVQTLYNEGVRTFLVWDVGPQGCGSFWLSYYPHSPNDFDEHGCSISYNDAVLHYNILLRAQLSSLRKQLKDATIIYVNTYDIIYDFFANPSKYGFKATTKACCGVGGKYNYRYNIQCGASGNIAGRTVKAVACSDPDSCISWDGVHWTDEANRLLTKQILSGKYFEPSFPIASFCDLQPL